ncbi:FAD-dependent oxidoreductase [Patescibacteria group bacterium]|nr:FAD-dependent oxidoreductase [Patescibacteria group bacterium]
MKLNLLSYLWPIELRYIGKKQETEDIFTFSFKPRGSVEWKAGQYLDYRLGFGLVKHFTIATAPYEEKVNITTRIFEKPSNFKKKLLQLKSGDTIYARDTRGELTIDDYKAEYVFIAGGIGITPFRSIIWDLVEKGQKTKVSLLYANSNDKLAFKKELEEVSEHNSNININYFIEPRKIEKKDLADFNTKNTVFMIAGPPKMVEFYEGILSKLGVSMKNIKSDPFWGY